jgi:hypothetical protein
MGGGARAYRNDSAAMKKRHRGLADLPSYPFPASEASGGVETSEARSWVAGRGPVGWGETLHE